MYSRRQRSTRNAAVATNTSANNARTTRGRTNKAKHPRRGGGNPDTARVRASIERPPVVPWIKVMRPPALHLRRTFLVEKWVRPSDLTEEERGIYEAEQKKKEEERQRMLKLQQQKREQEQKEKEREEQQQREQKEKERLQLAATAAAARQERENAKPVETKGGEQGNDNSATKLVSVTPAAIVSTAAAVTNENNTTKVKADKPESATPVASMEVTTTKVEIVKPESATPVAPMELEQTQALSQGSEAESTSTPAPTSTAMDSAQGLSEQTQISLTENKPTMPVATETTPPANTTPNPPEQKESLPQNTEQESKEVTPVDSSTTVNPSETKAPVEESLPQRQQKPSDTEDTSFSTEPLAKKPRVE